MEVVIFSLICISIFFGYLANSNNNENLKLKNSFREKEFETQYLLDEKEREILNLKRQFQTEKNKLLQAPAKNLDETLKLKRELTDKKNEISDLQKKILENEKIISDLRNINSSLNLKSEDEIQNLKRRLESVQNENEILKKNISRLDGELTSKNKSNLVNDEIYLLRNKNYELKNDIQNLNGILTGLKNENGELRTKIRNLENNQKNELSLFDEDFFTPTTKTSKKFVRVIFPGYSNEEYDYFLGKQRNIKVGDFVMVGTKKGARKARVVYVSELGEFSEHAKSEIIKKVN